MRQRVRVEGPASSCWDKFPPRVTLLGLTSLCTYPFSWIPRRMSTICAPIHPVVALAYLCPGIFDRTSARLAFISSMTMNGDAFLLPESTNFATPLQPCRSLSALISREDVLSSRSILIATSCFFPVGSCSSTALYTSANWPLPRGLGPTTRKRPFRRSPSRKIGMGSVSTGLIRRVDAPLGLIILKSQPSPAGCWRAGRAPGRLDHESQFEADYFIRPRGPRSNRTCARASVPPGPRLEVAGFYHTHLRVI